MQILAIGVVQEIFLCFYHTVLIVSYNLHFQRISQLILDFGRCTVVLCPNDYFHKFSFYKSKCLLKKIIHNLKLFLLKFLSFIFYFHQNIIYSDMLI
jgi:hypothetical protein